MMKFYRVHKRCETGSSAGYEFFTTRRLAERCIHNHNKENDPEDSAQLDIIEINPKRTGILAALRRYASHPDNG